jgi:hypothetical protein
MAVEEEEQRKQTLDSILGRYSKGKKREEGLERLAEWLEKIQSRLDFKQSPRGWCYTLENERLINKNEFDRAEEAINDCRRFAYLPMNFCAEDISRRWENVQRPTQGSVRELFKRALRGAMNAPDYYVPDLWEGEGYYIQMFVEKVDLKSLFMPVCEKYNIPIANSHGWSDLNELDEMAVRFKEAEERGQTGVLLYCGDHDPWGLQISDKLRNNLRTIEAATDYDPSDLIIDRFGLNKEFIDDNNLVWIDNLISASGKDGSKSSYCYRCDLQNEKGALKCRKCNKGVYVQPQFVSDYIDEIGVRKCESNALVVRPTQGRRLAEDAIIKYLGLDSLSRFEAKRNKVREDFEIFKGAYPKLFKELERQLRYE